MGGRVKIVIPHVPAEMRRLYTSQDPEAKYFQDNIRLADLGLGGASGTWACVNDGFAGRDAFLEY